MLLQGFYTVTECGSLEEGAKSCITLSGLGTLAPNMILMGFKACTTTIYEFLTNNVAYDVCRVMTFVAYAVCRSMRFVGYFVCRL